MKRFLLTVFAMTIACANFALAQEMPEMPQPQPEHKFLERFVGDWNSKMEASGIPGQPPMECQGETKAKMMGPFWIVMAAKGEMGGEPMESIMQLGYDAKKKKYVGTWSDSCTDHMWQYEGTVEGETLTLHTEGPNMTDPNKMAKYREVIQFLSPDHYEFSSSMENGEGGWTTFMMAEFKKKK
jgi:hypothetical protein